MKPGRLAARIATGWMLIVSIGCAAGGRGTGPSSVADRIEGLAEECNRENPQAPWLTPEQFLARAERESWRLVDVRSAEERAVSVIGGAESGDEFAARGTEAWSRPVLVYCTAGCRSGDYTLELRRQGVEAYNLRGGVLAWALSGREFVTREGGPTRRVHVFGKKWNALPPGYQPVW